MKVTMFGAGYVGLVTGACLASLGHEVICVDVNHQKIEMLKQGKSPIYEPGLDELITAALAKKTLSFTTHMQEAIEKSDILFIAVGTPPQADGSADLQYIWQVANTIGEHMSEYKLVVDKSTVPVGTADHVKALIAKKLAARGKNIAFDVASNPEFLKEGEALSDFLEPDRIVLGVESAKAREMLAHLYIRFPSEKIIMMDVRSAEFSKYAANAMLATRISFMNEMSRVAEVLGADIENVQYAMGKDRRIGPYFLKAGCGYGGSCFPKDVSALAHLAQSYEVPTALLNAVMQVNDQQKRILFKKVHAYFNGDLKNKTIAVWGIAFKPNTDDIREAASEVLMMQLWEAGARVKAYDPVATENFRLQHGHREDLLLCDSAMEAVKEADALVIVTEWDEFKRANLTELKAQLLTPVIFDGRNIYDPQKVREIGLAYFGMGRRTERTEEELCL